MTIEQSNKRNRDRAIDFIVMIGHKEIPAMNPTIDDVFGLSLLFKPFPTVLATKAFATTTTTTASNTINNNNNHMNFNYNILGVYGLLKLASDGRSYRACINPWIYRVTWRYPERRIMDSYFFKIERNDPRNYMSPQKAPHMLNERIYELYGDILHGKVLQWYRANVSNSSKRELLKEEWEEEETRRLNRPIPQLMKDLINTEQERVSYSYGGLAYKKIKKKNRYMRQLVDYVYKKIYNGYY